MRPPHEPASRASVGHLAQALRKAEERLAALEARLAALEAAPVLVVDPSCERCRSCGVVTPDGPMGERVLCDCVRPRNPP